MNASSNFATVAFFTVFKQCRHRVNTVLEKHFRFLCKVFLKKAGFLRFFETNTSVNRFSSNNNNDNVSIFIGCLGQLKSTAVNQGFVANEK